MNVHRKGTDDAIRLRLKLAQESTETLQGMLMARDPSRLTRYSHDAKTRNAIEAVLRTRRLLAPSQTPEPQMNAGALFTQAADKLIEKQQRINTLEAALKESRRIASDVAQYHNDAPCKKECVGDFREALSKISYVCSNALSQPTPSSETP